MYIILKYQSTKYKDINNKIENIQVPTKYFKQQKTENLNAQLQINTNLN